MDRGHKDRLARRLRELAARGAAVLVATHDPEFAAAFAADRPARRRPPLADGPTAEVLAGGWYFATEVARVHGGAPRSRPRRARRCSRGRASPEAIR